MLHHVVSGREVRIGPLADYAVTPEELDTFLQTREERNVIDGGQDLTSLPGDRSLLITFDDGYRNNLTEALPVLERHEVPCLLFITTGFIDGAVYPYEIELAEAIAQADALSIPGRPGSVDLQDLTGCRSAYQELRLPLKSASREKRQAFMARLATQNGYERADVQREPLLSWDEVRTLSEHPLVTIGAHTHSHVLLSKQSWQTAWKEIRSPKRQLEEHIGKPVRHFSYPYGGNSIAVRQMVRWAGFQYGFTTQAHRMDRITAWNRYALPRIDIGELLPDNA
jgi:peptidoglycan/xylan/chitin deacetylase (PgdA/CDA1 family)